MDDQLLMDNYLMIIKSTIEVYVHGTLESSNKDVRKLLKSGLDNTLEHQANTYDMMTKYNWYTVDNVECSCICSVFDKVNNK